MSRHHGVNRPYGTPNTDREAIIPSNELLGYYRTSLRDEELHEPEPL